MKNKIIIRIDDVGLGLNKEKDIDMNIFSKMYKMFKERNIPYCPAIIPKVCDIGMINWMKENFDDSVTVLLHGWDHIDNSNHMADNEFANRTYPEIFSRLNLGRRYLCDLSPRGFSPPFNRYNEDVISACVQCGFGYFFAGYGREKIEKFQIYRNMLIIPCEEKLYVRCGNHDEIIANVDLINHEYREQPYVLTLHTTWEAPNIEQDGLKRLLDKIKDYTIDVKSL